MVARVGAKLLHIAPTHPAARRCGSLKLPHRRSAPRKPAGSRSGAMRRRHRRTSPERVAMDKRFGLACRKQNCVKKLEISFNAHGGVFCISNSGGSDHTILKKIGLRSHQICCQCVASKTCVKGQKRAVSGNFGRCALHLRFTA